MDYERVADSVMGARRRWPVKADKGGFPVGTRRRSLLALAALVVFGSSALSGQVIGTQCWNSGGVLQCNSQAGLLYAPPAGVDWGQNLLALAGIIQQQRALRALEEAEAVAEAAARERQQAAARLFALRARSVLQGIADSLRIQGESGRGFVDAATGSLVDLYRVNPLASSAEMREVVWPHVVALNRQFEGFMIRVVPAARPAADSLALSPSELALFTQALLPVTQDVFMTSPEASPAAYRTAIQPLLDRARVYFDSVRTVRR